MTRAERMIARWGLLMAILAYGLLVAAFGGWVFWEMIEFAHSVAGEILP